MVEQLQLLDNDLKQPIAVAYGMGVDSSAMLVGMAQRGIRPDLILFADVGDEHPETYAFEPIMQAWLKKQGFPPITTVVYKPKNFKNYPPYYSLSQNCLTNGTLPGISFGPASCSQKWKQAPQHNYIKQWEPARIAWAAGKKVIKLIGFDNSPRDRCRTYSANPKDGYLYEYQTPLQEWGWDRDECKRQIQVAGLPVPRKSSCFMCLSMKPDEVRALPQSHLRKIIQMEARANPRLRNCEGLWRSTVKGTRGATPRPGSMTQFIRKENLLSASEVDRIWDETPIEIVLFQEGYARAKENGTIDQFLATASNDYRNASWLDSFNTQKAAA